MQTEGPAINTECPSCFSLRAFTLRPFDDKYLPSTSERKVSIHIPIVARGKICILIVFRFLSRRVVHASLMV